MNTDKKVIKSKLIELNMYLDKPKKFLDKEVNRLYTVHLKREKTIEEFVDYFERRILSMRENISENISKYGLPIYSVIIEGKHTMMSEKSYLTNQLCKDI